MKEVLVLLAIIGVTYGEGGGSYGYLEADGPHKWVELGYPICGGDYQSPIDIDDKKAKVDPKLGKFTHEMFLKWPVASVQYNNGFGMELEILEGAYIIDDPSLLPGTFKLAQMHTHWAYPDAYTGSEHLINGKQYWGEAHLVHYNMAYGSLANAVDQPDGIAVFAIMLDIGHHEFDMNYFRWGYYIGYEIYYPGDDVLFTPDHYFKYGVSSFLPKDLSNYYRYKGSLTTPPCYESVIWTVFKEPVSLSAYQAYQMHMAHNKYGDPMGGNFRPVQTNHNRVTKSKPRH